MKNQKSELVVGIVNTNTKADFFKLYGKELESHQMLNCRSAEAYEWPSLRTLFTSLKEAGRTTTNLQLVTVTGKGLAILSGNRRYACIKSAFNVKEDDKGNTTSDKLPDSFLISWEYVGEMSEADFALRQNDQSTFMSLGKVEKYIQVKRLVNFGLAETKIINSTGMSKGSVQTPRKFILSASSVQMLDKVEPLYLNGTITGENVNSISTIFNSKELTQADKDARVKQAYIELLNATAIAKVQPRSWTDIRAIRSSVCQPMQMLIDMLGDKSISFDAEKFSAEAVKLACEKSIEEASK